MKSILKTLILTSILIYNQKQIYGQSLIHETPADMIQKEKYPSETHTVTTEDGYILTIHRIPGPSRSIPVFIQHGVFESAADFLVTGRNKSLAYLLSDRGYDVWLGNARGNTYSRGHKTLSTNDPKYWDFSWNEEGIYDIPACVTYISSITNNTLFYIGHSMGGSSFAVMASEKPNIAKNIRSMFGLAPAVYEFHIKQPLLKMIAPLWKEVQILAKTNGIYELLSRNTLFDLLATEICPKAGIDKSICSDLLFHIGGHSPEQLDNALLPSIWSKFPAGTSVKLFCHWLQQMNVNEFRNFDYGSATNLVVYKSIEPPVYNLSAIQIPITLFSSNNDLIVVEEDVQNFYNQVPNKLALYKVNNQFSHFDFLWAKDAPELVYSKIFDIMSNFNNKL